MSRAGNLFAAGIEIGSVIMTVPTDAQLGKPPIILAQGERVDCTDQISDYFWSDIWYDFDERYRDVFVAFGNEENPHLGPVTLINGSVGLDLGRMIDVLLNDPSMSDVSLDYSFVSNDGLQVVGTLNSNESRLFALDNEREGVRDVGGTMADVANVIDDYTNGIIFDGDVAIKVGDQILHIVAGTDMLSFDDDSYPLFSPEPEGKVRFYITYQNPETGNMLATIVVVRNNDDGTSNLATELCQDVLQ